MTKPRYLGCVAGSQDFREASPVSGNAYYVSFNNGNVNWNNTDNNGFVRARRFVSPRESQDVEQITLLDLIRAKREAARGKVPSVDMVQFESRWMSGLLDLQRKLNAGTWSPTGTTCFIASMPKVREIHAPRYSDRIVHHAVVPKLEAIYEPKFIHDSYSNRKGKGTLAAVNRLESFFREVSSGQGGGYVLQLDIWNFFLSIRRDILWAILKEDMQKAGMPMVYQRIVHALLRQSPLKQGVEWRATKAERAAVPPHKRLENAAPGCGIAIGNLSSQFFANVLLNELDQFIKHELKAKRYIRYVDDFVLVHQSREQLQIWQAQIEKFLAERLALKLKPDIKLNPLSQGCDFLGYVVYPTHTRVRRRVVAHARQKLDTWAKSHVSHDALRGKPEEFREIASVVASYEGHFRHANSIGLREDFDRRFPWLPSARINRKFHHRLEGRQLTINTGVHMSRGSRKGKTRRERQERRDTKRFA